jgi:hypothetical protein
MAPESSPINVGDLLARDVPLGWHEAVAVTQEVCAKLFGSRAVAPDPSHILLHPTGAIELLPEASSAEPPAQRLGYTLNALLQGTSPPAELRLFASQMTAGAANASIDVFSQKLAYFERPGRSRILQQLYERAVQDLAAARTRRDSPDGTNAPSTAAVPKSSVGSAVRRRAWARAVCAAVAVLVVVAVAAWGWPRVRSRYARSSTPNVVSRASSAVGSLVANGVASGRALLGKAGLIDVPPVAAPPEPERQADVRKRSPRAHAEPAQASAPDPPLSTPSPAAPSPSEDAAPAPPLAIAAEPVTPDATVYSVDDADVVPPALVWPQFTQSAQPDETGSTPHRGEVDLLVSENGTVDHVKFLNKPERIRQSMVLSAMKAWRYHPAQKDGHAVRYIVRVTLPF